jgi:hypothetical protein
LRYSYRKAHDVTGEQKVTNRQRVPGVTRIDVRLPDELLSQVRQSAARNHRSVNGELLDLIERSVATTKEAS